MLTNPAYLFALAGLAIPVVIHFLSRKEGKIIKLGSIRHVVETSTQQFKGIKLNEIILLMLRCAMITVFSLLLSGLRCSTGGDERWVLVEKGLESLSNLNPVLDSLKNNGYTLRLLNSGFPELDDSSGTSLEINYWQLVEELKTKNLSEAIVFSKNNVAHFKGMRSRLPSNIRWISQPLPPLNFGVSAVGVTRDSAWLRSGHSSFDNISFTTEKISIKKSPMAITVADTVKIVLMSDAAFNFDGKIVKAALRAIENMIPVKIVLIESGRSKTPSNPDWCLWLSTEIPDEKIAKNIIRIDVQPSAELIVQESPSQWAITKRLNQDVALDHNFTTQLAALLLSDKNFQEKIGANDRRMVSDSIAWSHRPENGEEIRASMPMASAERYLIILLVTLLLIERTIAYRRNQ